MSKCSWCDYDVLSKRERPRTLNGLAVGFLSVITPAPFLTWTERKGTHFEVGISLAGSLSVIGHAPMKFAGWFWSKPATAGYRNQRFNFKLYYLCWWMVLADVTQIYCRHFHPSRADVPALADASVLTSVRFGHRWRMDRADPRSAEISFVPSWVLLSPADELTVAMEIIRL